VEKWRCLLDFSDGMDAGWEKGGWETMGVEVDSNGPFFPAFIILKYPVASF